MKSPEPPYGETLLQQYHSINPPPQLENLVKEAVHRGIRQKRLKRIGRYAKRTGAAAAAFLLSLTVITNLSPEIAYALEQIPAIGSFAKAVTIRSFEHHGENTEALIQTPALGEFAIPDNLPGRETLNKAMVDYVNTIIEDYQRQLDEWGDQIHLAVTTDYRVLTDSEFLFSIQITSTITMASSYSSSKIFHLDKTWGELCTLSDFFLSDSGWQKVVLDEIQNQMAERNLKEGQDLYFTENLSISDDQNFYFNNEGDIVIVFDEYEVAPGALGIQEFIIPPEVLSGLWSFEVKELDANGS